MYSIAPQFLVSHTTSQYGFLVQGVPTPYVHDFPATEDDVCTQLIIEMNTASQHLLIELDTIGRLDRKLTTSEYENICTIFNRQITAQAALQRLVYGQKDTTSESK